VPPAETTPPPGVDDGNAPRLVDLYERTMAQAYWREGTADDPAVFSLYFRSLPERRNYILACGLASALRYLERLRFGADHLAYLETLGRFTPEFLEWLGALRFTGDVWAIPEGTPVFPEEPLLEIVAPVAAGQIAESFVMNQVCFQSVIASKAARVVTAADGRSIVDFGLRRMHGADAALKGARAFHVAGVSATSNVLAGQVYGVPVAGTMAHSYIQAHDDEAAAFRSFAALYPKTVLLVDTYDTLDGVRKVVELARELGSGPDGAFRVRAIRLDSGDLAELARRSREILDAAGLERVEILASGGLDEDRIAELVAASAPIDGFGVGTRMGVSEDAPSLDMAYKLVSYAGRGRMKTSPGKRVLPGRKQVFRRYEGETEDGASVGDTIARFDEDLPGRPLLSRVMAEGRPVATSPPSELLEAARERARREIAALPARVRALPPADPPYPVEVSDALERDLIQVRDRVRERVEG
jgi:nicotinate phosphoribosyltransferase